MTKLERVARAIMSHINHDPDYDNCMEAARAAVETLLEPSEEMVKAAEQEIFEHMPEARDWTLLCAKDAVQAAIGAILSEKSE
jgi:hypothetical protein